MLRSQYPATLRCGNQVIELQSPLVMGIVNATPDSFYAPSRSAESIDVALQMASKMLSEGARILDIGGMSSRPGAREISEADELQRVLPVVEAIHSAFPEAILSIDTFRSEVAKACLQAGATIINDISGGLRDPALLQVVAERQATYILMHMRGDSNSMTHLTQYEEVVSDILKYFIQQIQQCHKAGIEEIILDPGFGFAKTPAQNYTLINQLKVFALLNRPLMVGVSRKSTLSKTINRPAEDTLEATTALHMAALQNGASILRVHDVQPAMDTIAVFNQLTQAKDLNNKRLKPA